MLKTNTSLFHKVIACFWIFCLTFLSFGVVSSHMGNLRQIDGRIGLLRVDMGEGMKWLAKKSYQALMGNVEAQALIGLPGVGQPVTDIGAAKDRMFEQIALKLVRQFITSFTQFIQQTLNKLRSSVLEITQSWAATNTQLSKVQGVAEKLLALQNSRSFQCGSAGILNGIIQNFYPQANFDFCSKDLGNTQIDIEKDTSATAMAKGLTAFVDASALKKAGNSGNPTQSTSGTAAPAPVSTQEIATSIKNIVKQDQKKDTDNCATVDDMFNYITQVNGCMAKGYETEAAIGGDLENKLEKPVGESTITALNTATCEGQCTLAIAETGNNSQDSADPKKSTGLLSATGDNSSVEMKVCPTENSCQTKQFATKKFRTYDNQTEGLKKAFDLANTPPVSSVNNGDASFGDIINQILTELLDTVKTLVANAVGDVMKSVMASLAPFTNALGELPPLFNLAFGNSAANAADLNTLATSAGTTIQNIDQAKKNTPFNFDEMCQTYYADEQAKYTDLIARVERLEERCGSELKKDLLRDFETSACREYILPQQEGAYNEALGKFGPRENLQAECEERGITTFNTRFETQVATENPQN